MHSGLEGLPVELLYAVQLHVLSDTLPHVSRHLYRVFKSAPPSFHAEYILGRVFTQCKDQIITRALQYPLCTMEVFDALCRYAGITPSQDLFPKPPQRFFRDLPCRGLEWTEHDHPLPFLKYLSNQFPIVIDYDGSALTRAGKACFLPLISFLLDHCTTGERTVLLWAVTEGHEAVVELLLAQDNIDVNSKDVHGRTLLSWVADRGFERVGKLLLARNDIDVNSKDDVFGLTPLSWAVHRGCEVMVKLLLTRDDIDINREDEGCMTPLSWAAYHGHERAVKLLLARDDIDINWKDVDGDTPLALAAGRGSEGVVKLLLARDDIDVNSKDMWGSRTPLSRAADNKHRGVVKLLLARDDIERKSN